jgi:hypothetical protein
VTDNRRVKDVRPSPERRLDEFYGDSELLALGYNGEAKMVQLRLTRIRELEAEGRGPLAEMRRDFAAAGYAPRAGWPQLTTAWNEAPTPEWVAALERLERLKRQAGRPRT